MLITGVIHTKNEERNIARALRSLRDVCDRLIVADMHSTDSTRAIAAESGATVITVPDFGYVEPARALALQQVDTEWVLVIDADEIVTPQLGRRLRQIAENDEADVVDICRLNFMFGHPLRATGWRPDRHIFCFKRSSIELGAVDQNNIHVPLRPSDRARVLELPETDDLSILHFNYTDWAHFIAKMNRYTSIEAGEKSGEPRLRTLATEIKDEVWRRGIRGRAWRDGYRGLGLVLMMCAYRSAVWLKHKQLSDVGDERAIIASYEAIADAALSSGTHEKSSVPSSAN